MHFARSALAFAVAAAMLTSAQAHRPGSPRDGSRGSSLPPRPPAGSHDGFFTGKPHHGRWRSGSGSHPGPDAGQGHHGHWPVGSGSHPGSSSGVAGRGHGHHEDAGFHPTNGPHSHDGSHWGAPGSFNGEMKPSRGVHCGHGSLRSHGSHDGRGPGSGCDDGQGGSAGDATTAPPS